MNRSIKELVNMHNISERKEEYLRNRELIYKLERLLARMSLDHKVGTYINNRDKYHDLIDKREHAKGKELDMINKEIIIQSKKMKLLDDGSHKVKEYIETERECQILKDMLGDYYRAINEGFRYEFNSYEVPNIYVYQGNVANIVVTKNIILPDIKEIYEVTNDIIVFPPYELKSNREYRHFYNRVSFKYLEKMTEDYTFDLDNKNIGKVKIRK